MWETTHTHTRWVSGNPWAPLWALSLIVDVALLCVHTSTAGWILLAQAGTANNRLIHTLPLCVCVCDQTIVSFYLPGGYTDVKRPDAGCHAAFHLARSLYTDPRGHRPALPTLPPPPPHWLWRGSGCVDWVSQHRDLFQSRCLDSSQEEKRRITIKMAEFHLALH